MVQDQVECDLNHPIFQIIENITRRQILRLIACEHNYGNRIASILGLSTPGVHRHLKVLKGKNSGDISLISESEKSNESFSGHKGGEATLYEIDQSIGLFFAIFPNFIHSQVFQVNKDENVVPYRSREIKTDFFSLKPPIPTSNETQNRTKKAKFYELYHKVQDCNQKIIHYQKEMMKILHSKNTFMDEIDKLVQEEEDLEYEDRIIVRAITCLGPDCVSDLSDLLNMDEAVIEKHVNHILEKDLLEQS